MPEPYPYRYPNQSSYNQLPVARQHEGFHWQGRSLRHGFIMGYKAAGAPSESSGGFLQDAFDKINRTIASHFRQIDPNVYKMFQFNPSALNFGVEMMQQDSAEMEAEGGNYANVGVGAAGTSMELFFDRTDDIARSSNDQGDPKWRDMGVQWDLFDLLKVISGGDLSWLAETSDSPTVDTDFEGTIGKVQHGSLNHISGMLLDSAVTGSRIMMKPFIVVFNANLAFHVLQMNSFSFSYLRFTTNLVPSLLKVEMTLTVSNMGSRSFVTSGQAPTTPGGSSSSGTGTTPGDGSMVGPPGTQSPPGVPTYRYPNMPGYAP